MNVLRNGEYKETTSPSCTMFHKMNIHLERWSVNYSSFWNQFQNCNVSYILLYMNTTKMKKNENKYF